MKSEDVLVISDKAPRPKQVPQLPTSQTLNPRTLKPKALSPNPRNDNCNNILEPVNAPINLNPHRPRCPKVYWTTVTGAPSGSMPQIRQMPLRCLIEL